MSNKPIAKKTRIFQKIDLIKIGNKITTSFWRLKAINIYGKDNLYFLDKKLGPAR